ncbi:hypothetical protein BA1DRAFT_03635, partial [Photorhabdus aegyptia]
MKLFLWHDHNEILQIKTGVLEILCHSSNISQKGMI